MYPYRCPHWEEEHPMAATLVTGNRAVPPNAATFRRRRAVAAVVLAGSLGIAVVGAQGVLTGPGGVPASAARAGMARSARTVRAEPGDSLWLIAERHHSDIGLARYLDALIDLNGGTEIVAGQLVRLP
jgi:hypothetical protein